MSYFTILYHLYNSSCDGNSLELIFGEKLKFDAKIILQHQTPDYLIKSLTPFIIWHLDRYLV